MRSCLKDVGKADSRDGTEFVKDKTVDAPFDRNYLLKLRVELLHSSLNKPKSPLSILKNSVLRFVELLLISLKKNLVYCLYKFPMIFVTQNLNNRARSCHILCIK